MKPQPDIKLVLAVACTISFVLTSILAALWLSLYDLLRSKGMGFWQVVLLYAAFATVFSTISVVLRNKE